MSCFCFLIFVYDLSVARSIPHPAIRHSRGTLDVQRCLFNLHRRLLPIDVIRSKAQEYVDANLVDQQSAHAMVRVIEQERGGESVFIERHGLETEGEGAGAAEGDPIATKLNMRQLAELLAERERLMRQGGEAGQPTDQWRAFLMLVPL
jgi:hypothetical protein